MDYNKQWKILKEMGIPYLPYQTTVPASWEICMQVKKQQLELDMEKQTDSKLGKEYAKAACCHLVYLTYIRVHYEKCWAGREETPTKIWKMERGWMNGNWQSKLSEAETHPSSILGSSGEGRRM